MPEDDTTQNPKSGGGDSPACDDPFARLGVEMRFDLDRGELERCWLAQSARAHPDRSADGASAIGEMAALNDAKRTLEDPERRANALLGRLGGPAKEADTSLPDGFLVEMLEVREELEVAHASGDDAEIATWVRWADDQRAMYITRVGSMFASLGDGPTRDELGAIRVELNAWRYIERMIEQIELPGDGGAEFF